MNLIESDIALQSLTDIQLLVPVWSSPKGHELMSNISFFYYKTNTEDGIININHIDADGCDETEVLKLITKDTLVLGNRYLNGLGTDYEWIYFEEYGVPFTFNEFVNPLYSTYRTDFDELNDCIPLMRWYEILQTLKLPQTRRDSDQKYSDSITLLGKVEGPGVKVVEEKFIDRFAFNPQHIHNGLVYTKYNPYTVTGRPTNRHLNVNWSALPKGDGTRECIVSRWDGGSLIQMDYESFHLRIIGKLVKYDFPKGVSAHEHLMGWYGTGDYEEAKAITFRYLYGGLDERAAGIPFFQSVDGYIKTIHREFILRGKLVTPLFKREISFNRIGDSGEQKVFNYLLQATETEINYTKLPELLEWFSHRKSNLILYTYDAFLIDAHPDERDAIVKTLPTILERGGFPVRTYEGKNYNELVRIG